MNQSRHYFDVFPLVVRTRFAGEQEHIITVKDADGNRLPRACVRRNRSGKVTP